MGAPDTAERWYALRAYNTDTQYGYGTADEADRYTDYLNRHREINVYGADALTDAEVAALGLESARRNDGFGLGEALAAIAEDEDA